MAQYVTTKQVFDYLGLSRYFISENNNTRDNFGTGDGSTSIFYTTMKNIIGSEYVFSYGADEDNLTDLTETTDYTIDLDSGKFELTAAGITAVGANGIYGDYYYTEGLKDSVISDMIDKNTALIDKMLNRTYQASAAVTNETHIGKGSTDRQYRVKNLPLLTVTKVEISNTPNGSSPVYTEITANENYTFDTNTGVITLLHGEITSDGLYLGNYPPRGVPDRFRVSYTYGSASVDEDIEELCIMLTAKKLFNSQVLNALSRGTNGFETEAIRHVDDEIKRIVNQNKVLLVDGF